MALKYTFLQGEPFEELWNVTVKNEVAMEKELLEKFLMTKAFWEAIIDSWFGDCHSYFEKDAFGY